MNSTQQEKERIIRRNRRILVVGVVFSLCYLVVATKAFYLQVLEDSNLTQRALSEYCRVNKLKGKRGTIYDVNLRQMAVSTSVVSIGAHPEQILHPRQAAIRISRILGVSSSKMAKRLESDKTFVWIDRQAPPDKALAIKKAVPKGLEEAQSYCRIYPNKTLAAQALGFVGIDGNGLDGLEFYYDDYLKGKVQQWTIIKDALGRIFDRKDDSGPGVEAKNLVLTLDANIQFITEEALAKAVNKYNAKSGMAIVMVPQTGAIRAIANYPTFNPNSYGLFSKATWRDRAITDAFEPGSTMKIFLASAAIDSGKCTSNTLVYCEHGEYKVGGRTIHDTHPHDWLTLHDVVKFSSNIGATKIAEIIGPETLYDTFRRFGFGGLTGIDCPGEATGLLRNWKNWRPIETANIAFGQGVAVTAIQLITAASAIANHGTLMKPRIVKDILNPDGTVFKSFPPEIARQAISPKTAEQIKEIMHSVTDPDGTGPLAVPKGYTVCGKTGTAQIINAEGRYDHSDYNAVFVGFAPEKDPKLAVLVVVTEPQGNHYGGIVAAPAFRDIVRESLNYMNIPPKLTPPPKQVASTTMGSD